MRVDNFDSDIEENISIQNGAKLAAKETKLNAKKKVSIAKDSKLVAHNATIKTEHLENKGNIAAYNLAVDSKKVDNQGDVFVTENLNLKVTGMGADNKADYTEGGNILAKNANFDFTGDYDAATHKLGTVQEKLTLNANKVTIGKDQALSSGAEIAITSQNGFDNQGTLVSGKQLQVKNIVGKTINAGLLAAKDAISISVGDDLTNLATGVIHTDGTLALTADNIIRNLGYIYAKGKQTYTANAVINDVTFKGKVEQGLSKDHKASREHYRYSRYDYYDIKIDTPEFINKLDVDKAGRIEGEGGIEFIQKPSTKSERSSQGFINHGVVNVRGDFKASKATQIINDVPKTELDLVKDYLKRPANITAGFQALSVFKTGLSVYKTYQFKDLESFFNAIFGDSSAVYAGFYYGQNSQVLKLLSQVESPSFQRMMTVIFGANWATQDYGVAKELWKNFKNEPNHKIDFYPSGYKAKFLVDSLTGDAKLLRNGASAEQGKSTTINVGQHRIDVPQANFSIPSYEQNSLNNSDSQLEHQVLLELIAGGLFDKKQDILPKFNNDPKANLDADDKDLILETPEEQAAREKQEQAAREKLIAQRKAEDDKRRTLEAQALAQLKKEQDRLRAERKASQQKLTADKARLAKALQDEKDATKKQALIAEQKRLADEEKARKRHYFLGEAYKDLPQDERIKRLLELDDERKAELSELEKALSNAKNATEKQALNDEIAQLKTIANEFNQQHSNIIGKIDDYRQLLENEKARQREIENARVSEEERLKNITKVETNPLYRSRVDYIQQDNYVGAGYFLGRLNAANSTTQTVSHSSSTEPQEQEDRAVQASTDTTPANVIGELFPKSADLSHY